MEILKRLLRQLGRGLVDLLSLAWRPQDPLPVRRVVILEMTRLGDLVAATALLDPLAAAYPGARLELWGAREYAPLFEGDIRLTYRSLPASGIAFLKGAWAARRELRDPGLVLVSASPSLRNSLLVLLSRPSLACGYLFPRPRGLGYDEAQPSQVRGHQYDEVEIESGPGDHLVERAFKALRPLGLNPDSKPKLLSREERQSRLAVLHAGANWPWRRWPLERFEKLKRRLEDLGWQVELLPAEADPSAPRPDLAGLKQLLSRASLFVGNDSGPLHLAASLGTPCLGLFGPNLPSRSGPWPACTEVPAGKEPAADLVKAEGGAHRTLRAPVPCSPCAQTRCVQTWDWCMAKIRVEDVEAEIKKMEIPAWKRSS